MKKMNNLYTQQYLKKEQNLLIFIILFIGVMIPALSGGDNFNFWIRLDSILKNSYFHLLLFLALCLNSLLNLEEFLKKYEILSRFENYEHVLRILCKKIIISSLYLFFLSMILAISGAWIFSLGDRNLVMLDNYNIYLSTYILFFMIRMAILTILMNLIVFIIGVRFRKTGVVGFAFLNALFFLIPISNDTYISHFYNLFLFPQAYFVNVNYSSFLLEIVCSIIEIFILFLICRILYYIFIKRARKVCVE